jgi:hypothetical protein
VDSFEAWHRRVNAGPEALAAECERMRNELSDKPHDPLVVTRAWATLGQAALRLRDPSTLTPEQIDAGRAAFAQYQRAFKMPEHQGAFDQAISAMMRCGEWGARTSVDDVRDEIREAFGPPDDQDGPHEVLDTRVAGFEGETDGEGAHE